MNVLSRTKLEVKMGDRSYHFECTNDSPLSEINQALVQMNEFVLNRMKDVEESAKSKEPESAEVKSVEA